METKSIRKSAPRSLKYEKLINVEYASIVRNKKSVLELEGSSIEGMTWREFQIFLGEKIPPGKCYFTIKFKKSNDLYTGQIRAVSMDGTKLETTGNESEVIKAFKSLESKLSNATSTGGITFEMLMSSTKQGYESQVSFLNQQIVYKDGRIQKLESEIDELENDLDTAEDQIRELQRSTGSSFEKYIEIGEKLLSARFTPGKPVTLKESDASDIPAELLEILGAVDYSRIQPETLQKIISTLKQYISFLPLKGQ
jgi:hypothetical protein